jgi:hypothetical protein
LTTAPVGASNAVTADKTKGGHMDDQDFYKLTIGQKVWNKKSGREERIDCLHIDYTSDAKHKKVSTGHSWLVLWSVFREEYTLTPPKKTKRFWQWKICCGRAWIRGDLYRDDDGMATNGGFFPNWCGMEKVKFEDDFVDVEVPND